MYDMENPPAITIVSWKNYQNRGWKNFAPKSHQSGINPINSNCPHYHEYDKVVACVNNATFNLSEVLEEAASGGEFGQNITHLKFWSEDLSNFEIGKTFTLNNSFQIGKDSNPLKIILKRNQNYTILIHDPHYFLHTSNPDTIPKVQISMTDSSSRQVYLRATYHKMLDKITHHCETSLSYSFTACVKNSMSKGRVQKICGIFD